MKKKADCELIDKLGGTNELAEFCGISPQAVSQWRENGIPELRRYKIARALRDAGRPIPIALKSYAA